VRRIFFWGGVLFFFFFFFLQPVIGPGLCLAPPSTLNSKRPQTPLWHFCCTSGCTLLHFKNYNPRTRFYEFVGTCCTHSPCGGKKHLDGICRCQRRSFLLCGLCLDLCGSALKSVSAAPSVPVSNPNTVNNFRNTHFFSTPPPPPHKANTSYLRAASRIARRSRLSFVIGVHRDLSGPKRQCTLASWLGWLANPSKPAGNEKPHV